ncbi:MAG: N,N-dimethylformamidase beta subunit family domain-containing protein, partial [Alphaproteobacteria bacterium]
MAEAKPAELPITGYLDRFSARPGESLAVKISVPSGARYRARLRRVISGDPNPAGPGLRFEDLSARFDAQFQGRHQPIRLGSYALIPKAPKRAAGPVTWTALVWFQAQPNAEAAVISEEQAGRSVTLAVGPHGPMARISWPGGERQLGLGAPLALRRWHRLWLSVDPATGRILLGAQCIEDASPASTREISAAGVALPDGAGVVMIAAENAAAPCAHLTGKIEDPAIRAGFFAEWPRPDEALSAAMPGLLAGWDFARGIATQRVEDIGPQACHGALVNVPTRAVVGARWSGAEMCWRHAPADYAAIHFHADDLSDCGWADDFSFTVPADLRSGAY